MSTTIQHPAYVLERGRPSRATVGTENYDLDDEGVFTVEDEAAATQAMDRLADTYGVTYNDDGSIESESVDATPADADADESSADESDEDASESGTDTASESDTDGSDAYARDDLEAMEHDELKTVAADVGVDTDEVDMRSSDNVVAAILQQQSDGVSTAEGDGE